MKYLFIIISAMTVFCSGAYAQSYSYSTVTITGVAKEPYDTVGLFPDVHHTKPIKTSRIDPQTRQYSITVNIKKDMVEYESGMNGVDLRFWQDKNQNGELDQNEEASGCHFVIMNPKTKQLTFEVYGGTTYTVNSKIFKYDYGCFLNDNIVQIKDLSHYTNYSNAPQEMRNNPEETAPVVDTLKSGFKVPILGVQRNGWVVIPGGHCSYVYNPKFVQLSLLEFEVIPFPSKIQGPAKIYSHPSTEAYIIQTLKAGYEMKGIGRVKDQPWIQVAPYKDSSVRGYVLEEAVVSNSPPSDTQLQKSQSPDSQSHDSQPVTQNKASDPVNKALGFLKNVIKF